MFCFTFEYSYLFAPNGICQGEESVFPNINSRFLLCPEHLEQSAHFPKSAVLNVCYSLEWMGGRTSADLRKSFADNTSFRFAKS